MFYTTFGVFIRIVSNSLLNVFQKLLSKNGENASVINFNTYLGLSVLGLCFCSFETFTLNMDLIINILIMGFLGAFGNYFIIKALSIGELSALAPINSYKSIVAMLIGIFYLKELPSVTAILAIILIIAGTYFVLDLKSWSNNDSRAVLYRILALILSGAEAVFIKKIILMIGVSNTFFAWAFSGLIFSTALILLSGRSIKIFTPKCTSFKYALLLILSVGAMQYSTNYVFSKMNVACALALFQLSTILSVFLGVNIFNEKNLKRKLIGTFLMVAGAILIILFNT